MTKSKINPLIYVDDDEDEKTDVQAENIGKINWRCRRGLKLAKLYIEQK